MTPQAVLHSGRAILHFDDIATLRADRVQRAYSHCKSTQIVRLGAVNSSAGSWIDAYRSTWLQADLSHGRQAVILDFLGPVQGDC